MHTNGTDAAGSTIGIDQDDNYRFEDAYVGWSSGDMFGSLGKDFLDISIGRRQYTAGNGFLFYSQSSNGGKRGGYWLGDRHAADFMSLLTMKTHNVTLDLLYFESDDNPDSDTKCSGGTLDYSFDKWGGIGGGVYYISSDIDSRDSMTVYDIRYSLTPFATVCDNLSILKPITLEAEYVYEDADSDYDNGAGWYASIAYQFEQCPLTPTLTYRYARFEEDYDPLFYGFNDWGYWYQGEILGEYVLSNSNLNSHMVKLSVSPTDSITTNFFYITLS